MPMSLPPWKEVSAMRDYEWKSSLSAHMKAFIETNRLAGLKFERQECFLQHFDHFCFYNGYGDGILTKEMAESFIYGYGGAAATLRSKENLMYDFADFMRKRGYHAYLPEHRTKCPKSQHIPHIYTEDERRRFLAAVDSYPDTPKSFRNDVDPVFFRFLCGTGCRLSEALNLRIGDFDYDAGAVVIRHAKNDRSRIVPMCSSLTERLHSYILSFHAGCPHEAYLFPGQKRGKMDKSTAYTHFRDYLLMAGIPHPQGGPRIHDWRHTLAVENLRRWSNEGLDLSNMVPYLSAYLGHQDFRATQYYLRLTAEIYPELVRVMEAACWDIIPEGGYHEEA